MRRFGLLVGCLLVGCSVQAAPVDYQYAPGTLATEARAQWHGLTKGVELARGKEVRFSHKPNYNLTSDENDPYDLTDGKLSSREDDRIWFNKDAVGWSKYGATPSMGVLMTIDLGEVQPVGQIALRILGGAEQESLILPKKVEFLASNDGKQYYSLQSMEKLNPAEKEQADNKTAFYIPEEGKAFMAPFVSRVPVKARYIALRVMPISTLYLDQISVLKAPDSQKLTELNSHPRAQVFTDGLAVMPRHEPFTITTNIATPNWLVIHDNTDLDPDKNKLGFRVEVPQGLQILPRSKPEFEEIESSRPDMKAYQFSYDGKNRNGSLGPLWIVKDSDIAVAAGAKVLLTGTIDGKDSHQFQYPVQFQEIPETMPVQGLDVSLAWLHETTQMEWPHFLEDFQKMGFNYVSSFPRWFYKDKSGEWNEGTQKKFEFLKQARARGYRVIYNESPFHEMWTRIQSDLRKKQINEAEAAELFVQVDGKRGDRMNILYRGKYYQDEIQRVADLAALISPDHVYLDIEWWRNHVPESQKDPRVQAALKKSGKDWDEFRTDIGREVLSDVVSAIRNAVPQKKLVVGLYYTDPRFKIFDQIFTWNKIYPEILDIAMPELYIQGRTQMVRDIIRTDYDLMQNREIIPWLSTGTYGEYPPALTEPMVVESILNGARGVTYYWFGDFDPMDFYYHARAIQRLKPYEKLLQIGRPISYKANNSNLHYTAFSSSDEALILVGNYGNSPDTKVLLPLPFQNAKAFVEGEQLTVRDNATSIEVPPGEFRLVHFLKEK